jgi:DNA-binding ferritin-like protein
MRSIDKPSAPKVTKEPAQDRKTEFNVANAVNDLRQLIARADALAHAAEDLSDEGTPTEDREARRDHERLEYLIEATVEAVQAALEAADKLAAELSTHRQGA